MGQYFFSDRQRGFLGKSVAFVAITALLILLGAGNTSYASIAIHDARATADYWTERNPNGEKLYLTYEQIVSVNQAIREKTSSLTDLMNYPQRIEGATLKELILSAQQDFREENTPGEHYDKGGVPITQDDYDTAKELFDSLEPLESQLLSDLFLLLLLSLILLLLLSLPLDLLFLYLSL